MVLADELNYEKTRGCEEMGRIKNDSEFWQEIMNCLGDVKI